MSDNTMAAENNDNAVSTKKEQSARSHAIIVYSVMLVGMFISGGLLCIGGLIWAYIKRPDAVGTIYESHFKNAIKTFWIGFVILIIAFITFFSGIGWFLGIGAAIYSLFKYIKGLIRVIDYRAYS